MTRSAQTLLIRRDGSAPLQAYWIWGVGVLAFAVMVMQRTAFGVSGLQAGERFAVGASPMSLFVFAQIVVYVLAQIPAGMMVDRWGSRTMGTLACVTAAVGQLAVALSTNFVPALAARALVGLGDALILMAVLAVLPRWFPSRVVPLVIQLTIIIGQAGQILSAFPFLGVLESRGWTAAFGCAAAMSALCAILLWAVFRNTPPGMPTTVSVSRRLRDEVAQVKHVWRRPGTKLGYFGHTAVQFPVMVFTLLWGYPYLVEAQRLSTTEASRLLTVLVLASAVIAPILGVLSARYPHRRIAILLAVACACAGVWTALLTFPAQAPMWMLYLLVLTLAFCSPASIVAFDVSRAHNPSANAAVAQSIANVGGFSAAVLVMLIMGAVLDRCGGYTLEAFRYAWLAQYPFWIWGICGVLLTRRSLRHQRSP